MSLSTAEPPAASRADCTDRIRVVLVSAGRPDEAPATGPDVEVVARVTTLADVPPIAARQPIDVVLIDLEPTPRNVSQVARAAVALPDARFVALGVVDAAEAVRWAEAGVDGFVERRDAPDELSAVLASVMLGQLLCSPQLGAALLQRVRELSSEWPGDQLGRLTARELEIVALIGEGLSNAEIAERMSLRLPTVKNHVRSIMQKLQVRSRLAVATATRPR
jgi:DNA-binding NarL/FixJ family response regulator